MLADLDEGDDSSTPRIQRQSGSACQNVREVRGCLSKPQRLHIYDATTVVSLVTEVALMILSLAFIGAHLSL